MTPILLNDWADHAASDVFRAFDGDRWTYYSENPTPVEEKPKFKGCEILLASYSYENYSGDAFVLFRRDGKLFEVNGCHCSCYELEGQWEPEETTVEELRHRIEKGQLGDDGYCGNVFVDELTALLERLAISAQQKDKQ